MKITIPIRKLPQWIFTWLWFFLITTTIFILNLTPLITHIRHAPPGRTFTMIHNNAQDFFFYQSLMKEGARGAWLTSDPYTTEPHQPSIIFSYFLWLGKLASLLNVSPAIMYHVIRILFGFLFLLTTYNLLLTTNFPYPRLTYALFIFGAPFLHPIAQNGSIQSVPFMNWWTGIDPIRRAAYLPHHMMGNFLLVLTILLILNYQRTRKRMYLLLSVLLAPLMAFIHTPSLFIVLLMLPPTVILYFIKRFFARDKNSNWHVLVGTGVYWIIGLLSIIWMLSQTGRGFPWSQYLTWERTLQFPLNEELIGALGILFPFALVGAIRSLFSRQFHLLLVTSWFAAPLLLVPFASILGISNIRLIQGAPYLPLSILAMIGITTLGAFFMRLYKKDHRNSPKETISETPLSGEKFVSKGYLIPVLVSIIFLIFTIPPINWSLQDQIREFLPIFGNVYMDDRLFTAFEFIIKNYPPKTKTLGTFYTGNYLPAYTDTISYIGHSGYTNNIKEKEARTRSFFENKLSEEEAKSLLTTNNLTLVFQGPEEKPIFAGKLYPDILKPVYDTEEVTLYTLKK